MDDEEENDTNSTSAMAYFESDKPLDYTDFNSLDELITLYFNPLFSQPLPPPD